MAILTKLVGCAVSAKAMGFEKQEALCIGIGMISRREVALIVAQRGLKAGILDSKYFTAVILLIVVSSILTPVLLKSIYAADEKQEAALQDCTIAG